jgi:hypothetical protein
MKPGTPTVIHVLMTRGDQSMAQDVLTWPELAEELYDKLTGRNAEISYEFHDLEIFVPAHHSEDAPLARWKINGMVKISARDTTTT